MPVNMLIIQALIVSFLSSVFLFMPNVSSSFWLLMVLASQLYLVMYLLLFGAGIALRYQYPNVKRAYKIPFGNVGMWLVGGVGTIASLFATVVGFFPPSQLDVGNLVFFELFLILGMVIFCGLPFLILYFKKPSWKLPYTKK